MKLMEDIRPEVPIKTASVDADHVLDLRKVCKQFGTDPAVDALIDVDLVLRRGEWLSITGPSGSGKSTLLNILGCLDRPTSGQYLFDGIETTKLSENERAGLRSRRVRIHLSVVPPAALSHRSRERHAGGSIPQAGRTRAARAGDAGNSPRRPRASREFPAFEIVRRRASAGSDRPRPDGITEPALVRRADRQSRFQEHRVRSWISSPSSTRRA